MTLSAADGMTVEALSTAAPERPDLSLLRRLGPFAALPEVLLERLGPLYRNVASAAGAALDDEAAGADGETSDPRDRNT